MNFNKYPLRKQGSFAKILDMISKIINRAHNLLLYPGKTWDEIRDEKSGPFLFLYPLVLSLVQPVAIVIGYSLIGLWIGQVGYFRLSFADSFYCALVAFFLSLLGVAVSGFCILVLANYFSAEGDIVPAMKLAVYSATAPLLAGVFQIIPGIRILIIFGLYGAFLDVHRHPQADEGPA